MGGPILTMTASPAVESGGYSFRHSHSMPDLLSGQAQPQRGPDASAADQRRDLGAKSLPNLPGFDFTLDFGDIELDTTFSLSKTLTPRSNEKATLVRTAINLEGPEPRTDRMGERRKSLLGRRQSWMPTSKPAAEQHHFSEQKTKEIDNQSGENMKETDGPSLLHPNALDRPRSVSGSLASLARRSWISTSRSPSPSPGSHAAAVEYGPHVTHEEFPNDQTSSNKLKKLARKRAISTIEGDGIKSVDSRGKLGTYIEKMKQRPQSMLLKAPSFPDDDSPASSVASLTPASSKPGGATTSSPEKIRPSQPDRVVSHAAASPARDPLWSAFRNLESEYDKFEGKTPSTKMKSIRTTLVPFLRTYAAHASNKNLKLEHLEQRARILHKWWMGLLEMLDGKFGQGVAGTDRPTLYEVTTLLMMRPEWRQSTPCFTPLASRNPRERLKKRGGASQTDASSDESPETSDSEFVAESVEHNVRTMFTTGLMRQLEIAIDKMSQRHAHLSLVNFAGKACAYAFFFAPSVALVLVKLWGLSADLLRRTADSFGLPRLSKGESDDIVALFPPMLDSLGWTSLNAAKTLLKRPTELPVAARKIAWHGPWVAKWKGQESDLFFIFCKYYFILAEDFMPSGLPLLEKARAPAFLLVSAQMLSILDSTIHRQAVGNASMAPADVGSYAASISVNVIPVVPNQRKEVRENGLVVLLKDFLSGNSTASTAARNTFAETFMVLMTTSAKRTSMFDHTACFTLCDFLEETLVAYDDFQDIQEFDVEYIDWDLWIEVFKKILESNHAVSEVRVLALIFTLWDTLAGTPARKEAICMDWLLTEEVFYKWFANWSPMVRAYFLRLLCWRICRDCGTANDLNAKIFLTVSTRLKTIWSHYLWLKQEAYSNGKFPPSSAPALPTPGRRFLIIRLESPQPQPGLMMGFDAFSAITKPLEPAPSESTFTPAPDTPSVDPAAYKKKWSIIGRVLSFGGANNEDLDAQRRDVTPHRKPPPPPKSSGRAVTPPGSDSDSLGSSPTYETMQYIFKFSLSWNGPNPVVPQDLDLARPRLPAPAQAWVNARTKEQDGVSTSPAAGRPAPTRAVSGSAITGLIEGARNANASHVPARNGRVQPRVSTTFELQDGAESASPVTRSSNDEPVSLKSGNSSLDSGIYPTKPKELFAARAAYAGRALAEWALVVNECNGFVDRRRNEGVLGLREVEVPSLGVEGFGKALG
ncbi:hypothetical protein BX600DRAFT_494630 [Xylariales sp. PMI_506]|nr:hypothetical protein BX600DRAFT_494630 [Xylariales sp. PMI_506]